VLTLKYVTLAGMGDRLKVREVTMPKLPPPPPCIKRVPPSYLIAQPRAKDITVLGYMSRIANE
jgi:hypothetical protein